MSYCVCILEKKRNIYFKNYLKYFLRMGERLSENRCFSPDWNSVFPNEPVLPVQRNESIVLTEEEN